MTLTVSEKSSPHGTILIITDTNLIGKTFSEGKLQLDLSQTFYQGSLKTISQVKELISKSRHLHVTGEQAIKLCLELHLIDQEKILVVDKIPHAQVVVE
jgi:uncharacterized protein